MSADAVSPVARTTASNNLAYVFQEVLTAVLRVRYQPQQVPDATAFRTQLRKLLQSAMGEARTLGYASANIQMGMLVVVGFLDESVLNSTTQSPLVAEWSRRPLQEELFGGHLAGETVFKNISTLLQQQDSPELADVLELHALALELGYKGRYAFSSGGELHNILQLCRQKIARIRGQAPLFPAPARQVVAPVKRSDSVARALLITTAALAVLTVAAFAGYEISLSSGASHLATSAQSSR